MDQVICIKRGKWVSGLHTASVTPIKGAIYTITEVEKDDLGDTFYVLAEMGRGASWLADHFRPVKKTDISCFTSLLKPTDKTKKREKEVA